MGIYLSTATPHFLTRSNMVNVSRQTSITAILAIGQTLVIISGGIPTSVVVAAAWGILAAVLMTQLNIAGLTIGPISLGGASDRPPGGYARRRDQRHHHHQRADPRLHRDDGHVYRAARDLSADHRRPARTLSPDGDGAKGYLPEQMIWLGSGDLFGLPVAGLVAMAVVTIGWFILRYTALGRSVYAVGGNREAARVSGINVDRTKIMVYVLSGLAAVAGFRARRAANSSNA